MIKQKLTVLFLIGIFAMSAFSISLEVLPVDRATAAPVIGSNIQTFSTGLSGGPVVLDESTLSEMVGGYQYMTQTAMSRVIEEYFVPMGIRFVFLDIGWMDGSTVNSSSLGTYVLGGYQQWIADWLEVSQQYGIYNIFFTKQFGYFFAPGLDTAFLQAYPGAQTVNSQGEVSPLVNCAGCTSSSGWSIASPYVYQQMSQDVEQLYKWYGNYSSWIGIGEGATGDRNYYAGNGATIKSQRPWDNGTIYEFANSIFFQRNINSTGYYLGTNVLSKVWSMFLKNRPQTPYSLGYGFVNEINREIYSGSSWTEQFYVPSGNYYNGFLLKAYLGFAGTPSAPLTETLQANYNGHFQTIEVRNVSSSQITSTGWVGESFSSTLVPTSYYQVIFSSTTSSSNYYTVASDNIGYPTAYGSILWIQSLSGANITLYPYVSQATNWRATPSTPVYFEVPNQMTVNTLNWFVSDRSYDPNNVSFSIMQGSSVLASGTMSLKQWRGASSDAFIPYQLNKVITLYPGIQYKINFSALPTGDNYAGNLGGGVTQDFIADNINPSYLGQSVVPTFQLSLENPQ